MSTFCGWIAPALKQRGTSDVGQACCCSATRRAPPSLDMPNTQLSEPDADDMIVCVLSYTEK
jgi:hypothetical protein